MTEKIFGCLLIASPFITLFVWMWKESGIKVALLVYGIALLILSIIGMGVYFVS